MTFVVSVVTLFAALLAVVCLWGMYLDRHEHELDRIQSAMLLMLAVATCVELGLYVYGFAQAWLACIALVANLWGGLDALLRYPVAHRIDSFFCIKQVALLFVKIVSYTLGMVIFSRALIVFLAVLLLDICVLSVAYCMSLPFDPRQNLQRDHACNVDLALRFWRLAACSAERRKCAATCRGWMHRRLVDASESSDLARMVICAALPEHRRRSRRTGRSV